MLPQEFEDDQQRSEIDSYII